MVCHQYKRQDITFDAEGTRLRGWLYQPLEQTAAKPCIVMAHGYNCVKELYLDKYAEVFAKAGYVVLAYDHRNLGESDGDIRQELDPWQQIKDYRHAISFVQTLTFVNPEKIGIWGTSYAGGHVLVVAAIDKRVKCVVSQIPIISGWQTALRRMSPSLLCSMQKEFNEDRINRFLGQPPRTIAMISEPHSYNMTAHANEDAWDFFFREKSFG